MNARQTSLTTSARCLASSRRARRAEEAPLIPAKAGIQALLPAENRMPAFAGMSGDERHHFGSEASTGGVPEGWAR